LRAATGAWWEEKLRDDQAKKRKSMFWNENEKKNVTRVTVSVTRVTPKAF
jgi:hypothetical protein